MNVGKTLFAQVMEFVPWTSFERIVQRYGGNAGVRTLSCAEQFRAMAFAQMTWRESLRDIEASLSANASKLYAMGFRSAIKRSTLADANESRDWHIWSDLAAVLIRRARKLYAGDALDIGLDNTVYALDSSTIDLCLSLFEWAPFRSTKAAVKLHTLLDLRGAIPAFIHISDGKLHDVNVLDMLTFEAGAFYVMDRGYVDFARLYALHQAGAFFVTRAKSPMDARRVYSAPTERSTGVICDQRVMLNGYYSARKYPEHLRRIRFKDAESGKTLVFLTNNTTLPAGTRSKPARSASAAPGATPPTKTRRPSPFGLIFSRSLALPTPAVSPEKIKQLTVSRTGASTRSRSESEKTLGATTPWRREVNRASSAVRVAARFAAVRPARISAIWGCSAANCSGVFAPSNSSRYACFWESAAEGHGGPVLLLKT